MCLCICAVSVSDTLASFCHRDTVLAVSHRSLASKPGVGYPGLGGTREFCERRGAVPQVELNPGRVAVVLLRNHRQLDAIVFNFSPAHAFRTVHAVMLVGDFADASRLVQRPGFLTGYWEIPAREANAFETHLGRPCVRSKNWHKATLNGAHRPTRSRAQAESWSGSALGGSSRRVESAS